VDKKTQLLDAAERVYWELGNLGLTVRRLAAEGDTTSQTIYTYFGSRDAVIVAMYDRILADLAELLARLSDQMGAGSADPRVRLVEAAMAYRQYGVDKPARFKMLAEGKGPEGTEPAPILKLRSQLVDVVDRAMTAAGSQTGSWSGTGARPALALLHGLIQSELVGFVGPDVLDAGALWDLVARVLGLDVTRASTVV
jgi:AcrR family transcriptional regulator